MADETLLTIALSVVTDRFKVLKEGNVAGSVYRVLADEPVPVYDTPTHGSQVMVRLKPGALLVGFSDPGEMRQINTAGQMFGYIKRSVKLVPVAGLDPEGLYDPEKRAAVETRRRLRALCYIVDRSHVQYAGRLTLAESLHHVRQGHGKSGPNRDYVLETVQALDALGYREGDLHLLAGHLQSGIGQPGVGDQESAR